uniref:DUF4485 domain-containing protein n=1 Tax=Dendroctonus ponderosae TaxID=77166 RepID=A0AAR5QEG8_DENPD
MDQQDDLEVEFRKILCVIRQHIPHISSTRYLLQCRFWLEKLSASNQDKVLRNFYLAELCRQIQANKLLPPFNEAPPNGKLTELCQEAQTFHNPASEQRKQTQSFEDKVKGWKIEEHFESDQELLRINAESTVGNKRTDLCCGEPVDLREADLVATASKSPFVDDDSWSDLSEVTAGSNEERLEKGTTEPDCFVLTEGGKDQDAKLSNTLKLLKDTNYLSQDWKKTIAALQLRLSEMIQQNNQLNGVIQKLKTQLEENTAKNQAQNDRNVALFESQYNQEMAKLTETHEKAVLDMQKSLEAEYEQKRKTLSSMFEEQILSIKTEHEEVLYRKDSEICRLSEIIQSQCLRIMNELSTIKNQVSSCSCDKKIHVLKKCVSKMDKVFQRTEKEYLKQIEQLRQELELKDSALQVQLKVQKAELIAQTRTGQKEEFEEILNGLEVKYIKMLEAHEQQIMKTKLRDDKTIEHLKDLLVKHGIAYHDN